MEMKKIFILSVCLVFISIFFINSLETVCIIPIFNENKNNDIGFKDGKFITDILKNEAEINKFPVLVSEEVKTIDFQDISGFLSTASSNNAGIAAFGKYNISDKKITILLKAYNVKNGKLICEDNLNKSMDENKDLSKIIKSFCEDFVWHIKSKYKYSAVEEFSDAIDFSVGALISPLMYKLNYFTEDLIIDKYKNTSTSVYEKYFVNGFDFRAIPIAVNASFTYYKKQSFSFGLSGFFGYSNGYFTSTQNSSRKMEYLYINAIVANLSLRLKYGKLPTDKFLSDFGIFYDMEFLNKKRYYIKNYYYDDITITDNVTVYNGNITSGVGPYIALGFEKSYKNFSFEFQGFITPTFGWKNTEEEQSLDPGARNFNALFGIMLKFNYYKLNIFKK
jgi:hypothetical protein